MSDEKKYTADEVASKVLEAAHNMLKKSDLFKSNNAHEVEIGEEPKNDDAEAPEYLANADIEDDGKDDEKRRKSVAGEGSSAGQSDPSDPEHEQGMSADEEKDHDAAENEADEQDGDNIEADEEDGEEEDVAADKETKEVIDAAASDSDKKKPFGKSEKGLGKLRKFLECREDKLEKSDGGSGRRQQVLDRREIKRPNAADRRQADRRGKKRMATPQESTSVADRMKYKRMATPAERASLANKKKMNKMSPQHPGAKPLVPEYDAARQAENEKKLRAKQSKGKNKKMEKFLGVDSKQDKASAQAPMKPQPPQEPQGSGMKGY